MKKQNSNRFNIVGLTFAFMLAIWSVFVESNNLAMGMQFISIIAAVFSIERKNLYEDD